MTVASTTAKVTGNGNGLATVFSFSPVVIYDTTDLEVTFVDALGVESLLSEGTGANAYAVVPASDSYPSPTGVTGSVRYPEDEVTPIASSTKVIMKRVLTLEQLTVLQNQSAYFPKTLETQLDKLAMLTIQQEEKIERSMVLPISVTGVSAELPVPVADRVLGWDATATAIINNATAGLLPDPVTVAKGGTGATTAPLALTNLGFSAFGKTLIDGANAAAGRATLAAAALAANTFTGVQTLNGVPIEFAKGAAVGSASSCDIWGGDDGNTVHITGTTTVDDFGTAPQAGAIRLVIFDGAVTVNDSATITVDGNANIAMAANDMALVYAETTTTFLFKPLRNSGLSPVGGKLIQEVSTTDSAVATGTTLMPTDDTIPQNTEGDEYMTRAITPNNTNNILVVDITMVLSNSAAPNDFVVALFQDSTANSLAAVGVTTSGAARVQVVTLRHVMTAGTVIATTFKARAGCNLAGTTTFNGESGTRVYGGVAASSIVIREYVA